MSHSMQQQSLDVKNDLEKIIVTKTTKKLIPLMVLMYIVAYIDRQNISFAKLQMVDSLGQSEAAFGLGALFFFAGYSVLSVSGNLILSKVGAKCWFTISLLPWGVATMALAWTERMSTFYTLRFILGTAETSFYPGLTYYSTKWFPLKYRPRIVGLLVTVSMVANMIDAPINDSLPSMHGLMGLEGWQWLFLATRVLAFLLIAPVLLWFPQGPEQARFLNAEEKSWLTKKLAAEQNANTDKSINSLGKPLTDRRVPALTLVYGFICFGAYGTSYWMPTAVKTFGASDMMNGLVNMIPQAMVTIMLRWITGKPERTENPYTNIVLPMFTAAICLLLLVWTFAQPVISLIYICGVVLSVFAVQPCFWNLTKFLSGATAATGIVIINSLANLGGFFAQNTTPLVRDLERSDSAPMLYLSAVMLIGGIVTILIVRWLKNIAIVDTKPVTL